MLSGAAPLPGHVEEFLRVTSCSTLSQGYGMLDQVFFLLEMFGSISVVMAFKI
jgi:long-chain acyl-CoA synthetase